jgi:phosphatidylglycerol---prolipoprotein diacylglyceryl transferase
MYPDLSYVINAISGLQPDNWFSIIKTYGLLLFLSIITAAKVFEYNLQKSKDYICSNSTSAALPAKFTSNVIIIVAVMGIVGAKVFAILEVPNLFKTTNLFNLVFKESGISFLGGLVFASTALILYFRSQKLKVLPVLDASVGPLLIGYSIGRLGCHLSGDGCWGIISGEAPNWWFFPNSLWGTEYPHNIAGKGVPILDCTFKYAKVLPQSVFPTSLYESLICFLLFVLVSLIPPKRSIYGLIFGAYLIITGLERFLIEYIRTNIKYQFWGHSISQAQIISVGMIVLGVTMIIVLYGRAIKTISIRDHQIS